MKMGVMETSWLELAQDHIQWRALILAALAIRVMLQQS
jgi:hypothetical protein